MTGATIPDESVQVTVLAVVIPSSQRVLAMVVELAALGKNPVVSPLMTPATEATSAVTAPES